MSQQIKRSMARSKTIGTFLYDLRIEKNYKQYYVAKKIGVSPNTLLSYEKDRVVPPRKRLLTLLDIYGSSEREYLITCHEFADRDFEVFRQFGLSDNFTACLKYNALDIPKNIKQYDIVNILNILFENPIIAEDLFESLDAFFNYDLRRSIMKHLANTYYDSPSNPRSHERYAQTFIYGISKALELIYQTHFKSKEDEYLK